MFLGKGHNFYVSGDSDRPISVNFQNKLSPDLNNTPPLVPYIGDVLCYSPPIPMFLDFTSRIYSFGSN